jgi:general secretion pathway protein B
MSFILDALKKSENERQRQIGPSLADVQTTRRLPDRPWWAVAVAALLVINLGVLVVVLMRSGEAKPAPATQAPAPETQTQSYNTPSPPPRATRNQAAPPAATDPSVRSLADEASGYEEPYPAEPANPNLAGAADVPARPPIVRQIAPPSVAPLPSGAVFEARSAGNASNAAAAGSDNEILPTLNELTAAGTSLPELHLDIHVHSQKADERFVFVNMRKYLEGETLKEGPSVERITAEGVVLNQRGLRFLLPRQ